MAFAVKICGLREPAHVVQASAEGAAYVGFVLFPPSPRAVTPVQLGELIRHVPDEVRSVGVVVDPSDEELDLILEAAPLDVLQLHGYETPERAAAIGLRTGCRIMKAVRVEDEADFAVAERYAGAVDLLMLDAKPPRDAAFPGGHGLPFDWRILEGRRWPVPWALAGGLATANLRAAVELVRPDIVDLSSGVESRPGVKDPAKITAFMAEARSLGAIAPETVR